MNNKLINHLKELLIKNNYLDLYTFLDVILYNTYYKYFLNKIEFYDNFDVQCSKYTLNVTHSLIMHEHTYGTM